MRSKSFGRLRKHSRFKARMNIEWKRIKMLGKNEKEKRLEKYIKAITYYTKIIYNIRLNSYAIIHKIESPCIIIYSLRIIRIRK